MKPRSLREDQPPLIALYLNHLEIGGAETIFLELAHGFASLGFRVDFVLVQARGALLSQVEAARVIDLKVPNAYLGLPALVRYFSQEKPDVLISITQLTGIVSILSRWFARASTRVAVVLATTISRYKRTFLKKAVEKLLLTRLFPRADSLIAVSKGVAEDFSGYTGFPLQNIKVIYSPVIKPQLFKSLNCKIDHPFFQDTNVPVVLGVGRLIEAKDFSTLIQAFALLRQRLQARLLILGEGEMHSQLEMLTQKLGLQQDVSIPGYVESPFPYMSQASVFVLSSQREGLPSVLIEAMACGAPIVSTDCPSGPAEILNGGLYGHLVPVGDVAALANAIESSLRGDQRKPPQSWLHQFESTHVIKQYLNAIGLKKQSL